MKPAHGAERINQSEIRKRATPMDRTLIEIDLVDAVASAPTAYTMGAALPQFTPGGPGCPPHFPRWVPVMHQLLTGVLGSHSKASRVMRNPHCWRVIRRHAKKYGAPRARRQPPEHWHHTYSHRQLDAHIDTLQTELRSDAIALAREIGCLDPKAPFSHPNPLRGQFTSGDGKVVASPVRKRTVEKWKESGTGRTVYAHLERQNGEDHQATWEYGSKFALLHTRPDNTRNNRVILDVEAVPHGKGYGGEARVSLEMIERLAATKDIRIDGVCYDGAFTGKHIDPLLKRGITVLSPMQKHKRTTPFELRACTCGDTHDLVLIGGTVHERTVLDTGERHSAPCPRGKVMRRKNGDDTFRHYIEFAMQCGTIHSIRVDTTPDDRTRDFKRSHHLRLHIKTDTGDSVYDRCYGWREDSESANNTLDRTLYGGRMIAYTATRQLSVMIGFAAGRNAIARWLHRQQPDLPPST